MGKRITIEDLRRIKELVDSKNRLIGLVSEPNSGMPLWKPPTIHDLTGLRLFFDVVINEVINQLESKVKTMDNIGKAEVLELLNSFRKELRSERNEAKCPGCGLQHPLVKEFGKCGKCMEAMV